MPKCHCNNPPGGGTACPDDCAAVCQIENGVCQASCIRMPAAILEGSREEMYGWFLTKMLGKNISVADVRHDGWVMAIIQNGYFKDPATGATVRFSLPDEDASAQQQALAR